jgi:hypothetical protein
MTECHEIILRQHDDGPNPPDLLQQIVDDIKKLVPESAEAGRKWLRGKSEQELARVQEIKARVYKKIAQIEIEREKLIQQRDESDRKAQLELRKQDQDHECSLRKLEIARLNEKTQALKEVVDCIVRLRGLGIEVDLKVIKAAGAASTALLEDTPE